MKNQTILSNGYVGGKFVKPRTEKDTSATFESFKSRSTLFSILEEGLIAELTSPSLVSSVHGGIKQLFFTIPDWVFFSKHDPYDETQIYEPADTTLIEQYADVFKSILGTIPESSIRTVFTHEISEKKLNDWLVELGVVDHAEVITVPKDVRFTVWAEDAYCICNDVDDGEKYFVEPASFNRAHDAYIADIASNSSDINATQVQLYFQGGNILIGDDFWMIGADYPTNSLKLGFVRPEPNESERDAIKRVYGQYLDKDRNLIVVGSRVPVPSQEVRETAINGELWKEILYFGNHEGTVQPLFHIDMFITLVGKNGDGAYRVLVADPRLASEQLGEELPEGAMQPVFDDIAAQLTQLGFEVVRNPMPIVYDDDVERKERYWYFATSNNVILQDSPKIVWIPTYGHGYWSKLSITDNANRDIWHSLDYEVRQLPNFHPFAANLGAAHCITKYINRG